MHLPYLVSAIEQIDLQVTNEMARIIAVSILGWSPIERSYRLQLLSLSRLNFDLLESCTREPYGLSIRLLFKLGLRQLGELDLNCSCFNHASLHLNCFGVLRVSFQPGSSEWSWKDRESDKKMLFDFHCH